MSSAADSPDGEARRSALAGLGRSFDPEEFRRRNASAVAIDLLYLFTTAFLATLSVRGFWPAVIAAVPLATLLYFAWRSSTAFFVATVLSVGLSVAATETGLLPL